MARETRRDCRTFALDARGDWRALSSVVAASRGMADEALHQGNDGLAEHHGRHRQDGHLRAAEPGPARRPLRRRAPHKPTRWPRTVWKYAGGSEVQILETAYSTASTTATAPRAYIFSFVTSRPAPRERARYNEAGSEDAG
jgi:hypothetical protein